MSWEIPTNSFINDAPTIILSQISSYTKQKLKVLSKRKIYVQFIYTYVIHWSINSLKLWIIEFIARFYLFVVFQNLLQYLEFIRYQKSERLVKANLHYKISSLEVLIIASFIITIILDIMLRVCSNSSAVFEVFYEMVLEKLPGHFIFGFIEKF